MSFWKADMAEEIKTGRVQACSISIDFGRAQIYIPLLLQPPPAMEFRTSRSFLILY
jgi:hypothetical protein